MDVKQAAIAAKLYLIELYEDENITNVGLEEIEFDHMVYEWKITFGFSRPWDQGSPIGQALAGARPNRSYKVIRVSDEDGQVMSVRDRILAGPD